MARWLLILAVAALVPSSRAIEKHAIAHNAEAVVVGTLTTWPTFPWIDGWHIRGVIQVHETLYGSRLPSQVEYRFVCRWDSLCQRWPPPRFPEWFHKKAVWFLRRHDGGSWEPSVYFGCVPLAERAYWENYIRLHKR